MNINKKIAYIGVFTAVALIFSYIERLLPLNTIIPGIKPGIANIAIIIVLNKLGYKDALLVNITRICISALLFGSFTAFIIALFGGILSTSAMGIFAKTKLALLTVSIIGSIAHIFGQVMISSILLNTFNIFYMLPIYIFASVITGLITGLIAKQVLKVLV